jgi:hypothetical protein
MGKHIEAYKFDESFYQMIIKSSSLQLDLQTATIPDVKNTRKYENISPLARPSTLPNDFNKSNYHLSDHCNR